MGRTSIEHDGQGLEDILGALPAVAPLLADPDWSATPLPGGLTNHNVRVRGAGIDAVVRLSPPGTELLAIDREREHANTAAAAAAGVGAPVLGYLPGRGVLAVGFVPGRTYTDADVAIELPRLGAALRALHTGPSFSGRFDMGAIAARYLDTCVSRGFAIPEGYLDLQPYAARLTAALAVWPEPLVPCHNDLLAANFLDAGAGSGVGIDGIHVIDYEYSGMNEAAFELGNVIQEARLRPDHLAELVLHYYGADDPHLARRTARAELWGTLAAYGWTLWGMIQLATSGIAADFEEWAMAKFEDAATRFTATRFEALLDAATR